MITNCDKLCKPLQSKHYCILVIFWTSLLCHMFCSDVSEGSNTSTVRVTKFVQMTCKAMGGRKCYVGTLETIRPVITLWKQRQNILRQWELRIPNSPFQGCNHWKVSKKHDLWEVESDERYTCFMHKVALPQENRLSYSWTMPTIALSSCCHSTANALSTVHLHYFQSKFQHVTRHHHITCPQRIQHVHTYMNPTHS